MITLYEHIHNTLIEGILDGITNVQNSADDQIKTDSIANPSSSFRRLMDANRAAGTRIRDFQPGSSHLKDKHLFLHTSDLTWGRRGMKYPPLSDFFGPLDTLTVPGLIASRDNIFDNHTFANNIVARQISVIDCPSVENVDIQIVSGPIENVNYKGLLSKIVFGNTHRRVVFKNTSITFNGHIDTNKRIIFIDTMIPDMSGLKSNAMYIVQHDTCMFDYEQDVEGLTKIIDWDWVCDVWDNNKKEVVKRQTKNLKTLIALANNPKRYYPLDFVIKLKPGSKITDVYDISGCPDVSYIIMHNNNVRIELTNDPKYVMNRLRWASLPTTSTKAGIVGNNQKYDTLPDVNSWPRTSDGWWIMIGKEL